MSSGPRSLAFLIWIGRPGGWKMVHVSWGWKREGFVGQRYPTFNALVRRKMKNNQRKLAATDLVLPSYHTQLKIIQPLSRPFKGLLLVLLVFYRLSWHSSELSILGDLIMVVSRSLACALEGSSLGHGKGGSRGGCMLCVLLRPQCLIGRHYAFIIQWQIFTLLFTLYYSFVAWQLCIGGFVY